MSIIKVTVDDQALYVTESPVVAAQGVNENYFQFTLSSDWSGFGVVALFWKEGAEDTVYESVVDGTGKALVPHEVTDLQGRFCVGLAGTKGNIIHTSEVLKYKVVKGRYTAGQGSEPPTPGIYEQMLSLAGQMSDQFRQVVVEQSEVIEDLQEDQAALRSELTAQQATFQNTISGQMTSFIASQSGDYKRVTLWTSPDANGIIAGGTTVILSEAVENFDYVEIYSMNTDNDAVDTIPVDEVLSDPGYAVRSVNISTTSINLRIVESRITISGTTFTIADQYLYGDTDTTTVRQITQGNKGNWVGQFGIMKIVGRKMVENAEVADIRVGENGTTYQTAGAAVRGQFSAVKAQIPLIDASLATTGKAADAKATGDAITNVNGRLQQVNDAIQPLKLMPYICEYPSGATGYKNVSFTLPAGNYKVTVTGTSVNARFVDANITDVINAVPYTAVDYPIALTEEQAAALTYLRLAGGEVSVYPAETIVTNVESLQSDVGVLSSELHELTSDRTWIVPSNFEQGTLYVTGGNVRENPNAKRVRQKISTARHLTPSSTIRLTDYSHYKFMVFSSADNGETWIQGSWITSGDFITSGASTLYLLLIEDTTAETADVETLVSLIHYDEAGTFVSEVDTKLKNISINPFFAHLSFDDVQYCMIDLKNHANDYDSIFDNPFFAMLKNLHDVYGTVVSLYLFLTNSEGGISAYPTTFASEFAENADWLKFGIHQGSTNYANTSAETALSDYNTFTSNIVNIGGTVDIIDRCPRLGNFAGNLNSMLAMRDADGGIVGLLSAYDTRDSYYLSSADSTYLYNHGKLVDSTNHLTFFRTIKTFEVANPSTELPKLQTLAGMNGAPYGIIMMHEYAVYNSDFELVDAMKTRLEYACAWIVNHGYMWDYPMNRIF